MSTPPPLLLLEGAEGPAPAPAALVARLEAAWAEGRVVGLAQAAERPALAAALGLEPEAASGLLPAGSVSPGPLPAGPRPEELLPAEPLPAGPAVVIGSGGSRGARRWCLQPLAHLQASARASALWLEELGLEPARCLHLNPLPLHHVSGLLPVVRARVWGAALRRLEPAWLRDPLQLAAACPLPPERPVLLSLVPTQLVRLMAQPEGRRWLQQCAVIWVGGAPLAPASADQARAHGLRLAPCYGATETAAMVAALAPERFLAGEEGCGRALADVALRLDPDGSGAVEVRSARLGLGWLEGGRLRPLECDGEGWWRSGDAGRLEEGRLTLLGRLDGALHSGGETLFPEVLEARLQAAATAAGLPLEALLLLGLDHPEWGQQLVALVRPLPPSLETAAAASLLEALVALTAAWRPAERPRQWRLCPPLAPGPTGKWERRRWQRWWRESAGGG